MDDGTTPLILAARFDLVDIVKDLIKAGAKVNNTDNKGTLLICLKKSGRYQCDGTH